MTFGEGAASLGGNYIEVKEGKIRITRLPGFVEETPEHHWFKTSDVYRVLEWYTKGKELDPDTRAEYLRKVADDAAEWMKYSLDSRAIAALRQLKRQAENLVKTNSGSFLQRRWEMFKQAFN